MSTTDLGYTPAYFMPVILPPDITEPDVQNYYNGLNLNVVAENNETEGINYKITGSDSLKIYATTGGNITFIPSGNTNSNLLPDGTFSSGFGTLVLQPGPIDFDSAKKTLVGTPIPTYICYINVKPENFQTAVQTLITALPPDDSYTKALKKRIDILWKDIVGTDPSTIDFNTKLNKFLEKLILGEEGIWVDGGTEIGEMEKDTAGEIDFTLKYIESGNVAVSPTSYLRNTILLPDIENRGFKWDYHPLVTAITSFATSLDFYIKFEVWNPISLTNLQIDKYLPIDVVSIVQLMYYDVTDDTEHLIKSVNIDSQGIAHISISETELPSQDKRNLFFKVVNAECTAITEFQLPQEWSTKGEGETYWLATDGTKGYLPNFTGTNLGKSDSPLTFRIGLDFHFKLLYFDLFSNGISKATLKQSPIGIRMALRKTTFLGSDSIDVDYASNQDLLDTSKYYINDKGYIHGVTFHTFPGDSLFLRVYYAMEDSSINMKRTIVDFEINPLDPLDIVDTTTIEYWDTNDHNDFYFENNSLSSLTKAIAHYHSDSNILIAKRNAALWFLKNIRELHEFLFIVTSGDWKGITVALRLYHPGEIFDATATSYPKGGIWYTSNMKNWDRGTIIHEYAHQIMWEISGYENSDIIGQFYIDNRWDGEAGHFDIVLSSPLRALTEGWANALRDIFEGISNDNLTTIYNTIDDWNNRINKKQLGPTTTNDVNQGFLLEGSTTNALYYIFYNPIVGLALKRIVPSDSGDIKVNNTWLTSLNSQDFINFIWEPLKKLNDFNIVNKTTINFFDSILNYSPNINTKHKLHSEMQRWNMMIALPEISNLNISSGSSLGGDTIEISGNNFIYPNKNNPYNNNVEVFVVFVFQNIRVYANNLQVISGSLITINTPAWNIPTGLNSQIVEIYIEHEIRNYSQLFISNPINFTYNVP